MTRQAALSLAALYALAFLALTLSLLVSLAYAVRRGFRRWRVGRELRAIHQDAQRAWRASR